MAVGGRDLAEGSDVRETTAQGGAHRQAGQAISMELAGWRFSDFGLECGGGKAKGGTAEFFHGRPTFFSPFFMFFFFFFLSTTYLQYVYFVPYLTLHNVLPRDPSFSKKKMNL